MVTTNSYSQLSTSLIETTDSWVYVNSFGEIRYDIPKFRMRKLERNSRQFLHLNKVYKDSRELVIQVSDANLRLQSELMLISSISRLLKKEEQILIDEYNHLTESYTNLDNKYNATLGVLKKTKRERNAAVGGLVVVLVAIIITR